MTEPVLVIVQARVESQRFYGKVLAPMLGQPLLLWLLDRVSRMQTPHQLVVASPDTPPNQAIADLCAKHGYECLLVPGDPNDVLARFAAVTRRYTTDWNGVTIIRVLADSPLTDPAMIDAMFRHHKTTEGQWDHTGVALEWGDGLEIDMMSRPALYAAHQEATLPSDREHCVPFIWRQPQRFRTHTYACPFDLSWLRCSIDMPEDLQQIECLFDTCLYRYGHTFGWRAIWKVAEDGIVGMKDYMLTRTHNPAYCAQVAREQGWPDDPEWRDLRHGEHDPT